MKILITGACGFIGFHLSKLLLKKNYDVFGVDNLNNYYDKNLKKDRLFELAKYKKFFFYKADILNENKIHKIIKDNKIKYIIHLAAQAGVRYSIKNPKTYYRNNIEGFYKILELSRKNKIKHLIFASTSSIYGNNKNFPTEETMNTDRPLSFYASTKKTNEIMAYSYSNIYKIPTTSLRFFTVYGPLGRPDMALFRFTDSLLRNKKINMFNNGDHFRDFTYIDDVIDGIQKLITFPSEKNIPYDCFNIGSSKSIKITTFLKIIESKLRLKGNLKNINYQLGDVHKTHSNTKKLIKKIGYKKNTPIKEGISNYIDWFIEYYRKNN